jgi:hypothetical protein
MDTNEITIGQAFDSLNGALNEWLTEGVISTESIEIFNSAVQADLNFRDILMGLPKHHELNKLSGFITYVIPMVDGADKVPYLSVLSSYAFEATNSAEIANQILSDALEINPDYPLGKLLSRVYGAGWDSSMFVNMRNQLDDKVRDTVQERWDTTIGEIKEWSVA